MKALVRLLMCLATAFVALGAVPGHAADFPARTVRIVVPFPAGGLVDQLARLLAQQLQEQTGQPFIVDNRAGANGVIGSSFVAKAPADGYTLLLQTTGFVIAPQLLPSVPYDVARDFTPLAYLGDVPMLVVGNPDLKVTDLRQLVALIRSQPGKHSIGVPITGSLGHLAAEQIRIDGKLDVVISPYKGTAPMITDVAGGHITAGVDAMPALLPMVRDGKMSALAVTGDERVALLPNVPTAAELGLPRLVMKSWFGLWGPAGLPAELRQKLSAEVARALASDSFRQRIADTGLVIGVAAPERLAQQVTRETAKYGEIIKAANIKAE